MSVLLVERGETVTRLTLNRPESGNALNLELATALRSAIGDLSGLPGHIVLLRAEGRLFCGGGDVATMAAASDPCAYLDELAGVMHDAVLTLARSELVLVSAVQGPAAGAGLALVLNSDFVIAADTSTFLTAYAGIGLSPDTGTSFFLPRVVGATRASEMLLTKRKLDAATALDWGIVNRVVASGELEAAAVETVEAMSSIPAPARGTAKRLLASNWIADYSDHLDRERQSISALAGTPQAQKFLASFAR